LGLLAQLEVMIVSAMPGMTAPTLPAVLIGLPSGLEMFYSVVVFISAVVAYAVAAIVAKGIFILGEKFRI
jgi:hypothetical protein